MYLHCHGFSQHASFGSFFFFLHRAPHFIDYLWSASLLHICDFSLLVKKMEKKCMKKEQKENGKKTKRKYHNLLLFTFFSNHLALNR